MPSFKKPKADADVDFDVEGGVDIDKPNLSGSVDVEGPDVKGKGSGFKLPDFNLPSFKKGKALDGDIDFDVKGGVDLDRPDLSGDIDLRGGDVDVKAKGPGFKMPDINLPSFKKPKAPDANVDLDVKGGVDLNKPKISGDVDLEGDGAKSKGWGIKLPDFELPSFKSPKADADVDLDTGKVNLGRGFNADYGFDGKDIDVNTGKVKLQNNIDLPEVDVGVKGPNISGDADVEGADFKTSSGFKMPDFKLPGFKRSKGKLPDADLDADADLDLDGSLKGGSINVKAPDVKLESGNIDMDLDVEGGKLKKDSGFKMPGFKLPSMKKGDADFDADVDVNAELPHIDVNKPELSGDVNLKGGEVKASKDHGFSMPDFKLPSFKKPEGKANIKGGGELGADLPDVDTKANIDVNVKGKGAKAKGSGFKFPGFKKPKVEAPDVNADVNLDSGKVNFDKRVRADVDLPDVNVNVGGKGGIGYDVPKVSGNAGLGTGNLNLNAPKVDIDLPQVDVETKGSIDIDKNVSGDYGVEGHGKGSKGLGFKLPEFKRPDFKKPNVNVDVKAPKTELEGGIKADFDLPDVEGPNVKRSGHGLPNAKVKAPGLHGPSAEVGKVNVNVPSADIDARVDAPRIDIPDTNVDVNVRPQGSPKGSGFKLPEFKLPSLHKPDANAPDVIAPNVDAHGDVAVKGKRINATVDVPNVNVNVSGQKPGVDIKAPEVKADKKHSGFKLPHFKMPGRKKASIKGPDVSGPDVTVPEVDIPNVEVTGPRLPEAGLGMPGVVMSGHTGSYRMEGPNTNLPNAEIDVKGPSIKTDRLKTKEAGGRFDADVQLPSVSLPSVSLSKDTPANKSSHIKAPSAALSGDFSTEFDASEVSFAAPKVSYPETDVSASISRPDVNVSKDHGIQLPHGDISVEAPDVNVALPNVGFSAEADIPGIDADKKRKKDDKSKKKEEEKGEKKKSGIQGWWQRRRRRRSSSSSSASSSSDSSDSEDEKKNKGSFGLPSASVSVPSVSVPSVSLPNASVTAGADVPSASVSVPSVSVPSVSVPSVSAPSASAPSVSSVSVPSVSVPSVEASLPDISASALPSFSTETYSKSVDISMTEPKLVSPTLSGSVESASVSVPDISSVAAPSLKGDENLELPKMSMEAENSSDDSDDEAQAQTLKFDMPPSVAQEIEVHTEPVNSSDDSEDDHEEISNWRGEMSMPTVNVAYPDESDVTNASMRVNLDQDSLLVRDEAVRDETTSEEEEDDQERVSAMLREYLADDPMLMERLGFGTEYSNPEASVEVSGDTSEFLSRNGEALSGARQEIRRRSQSSTPERRRKWVDSSSSSRSSSPRPSQSEDMTMNLPSVEMSTERESESPALKMSSGGIAYDITPSQLEHLSLEEREEARARGEPRGGMAYYFDINDQLRFRNDDDDEESEPHPPLVHPRNFETENVRAQLRTNHLTDSDQEDDDAENSSQANFSTSLSKPLSFNTNYRGTRDSDENLTFKTVETTSTTTVTRGVREHDSEGNKTYTVTITTSQMDDSEA